MNWFKQPKKPRLVFLVTFVATMLSFGWVGPVIFGLWSTAVTVFIAGILESVVSGLVVTALQNRFGLGAMLVSILLWPFVNGYLAYRGAKKFNATGSDSLKSIKGLGAPSYQSPYSNANILTTADLADYPIFDPAPTRPEPDEPEDDSAPSPEATPEPEHMEPGMAPSEPVATSESLPEVSEPVVADGPFAQSFATIGYAYLPQADGVAGELLSQKVGGGAGFIGLRPDLTITDVGYGRTDGRLYLTFFARDPRPGVMNPTAQVAGVYLGGDLPDFAVEPKMAFGRYDDFDNRFAVKSAGFTSPTDLLTDPVKAVAVQRPVGEGALWVSKGWLLVDTFAAEPSVHVARTDWAYLSDVIAAFGPEFLAKHGVTFGAGGADPDLVGRLLRPKDPAK